MKGFFTPSSKPRIVTGNNAATLVPRCSQCGLFKRCRSSKMPVSGRGNLKILVCGEGPGPDEDLQGRPFVGRSGRLLRDVLTRNGIDLRNDCWITNAVICFPHTQRGKIRNPTDNEISYCRPNLLNTIKELNPEVIILLGTKAVKSLIGWLWKEDPGGIGRWVDWRIPSQRLNSWICSNYHPAHILRGQGFEEGEGEGRGKANDVMELLFERYLRKALKLIGTRPWPDGVPDYASQVDIELDPDVAARKIYNVMSHSSIPIAFDFETNCLKPDTDKAQIVSCAVSNGRMTVAYPWVGAAIEATKQLVLCDAPKVASNMKFETRFTKAFLGCNVNNWWLDTMLAAHVLDNRKAISSIKFQSFVLLGQDSWDDHIKPYLQSKAGGGNGLNRIRELDLRTLLLYNGMDALLEWHVAQMQAKRLGITL